jgi:predicted AAA+ superfamily ATPase
MKEITRKPELKLLETYRETDLIKVVTGIRRCGKSTLLSQYATALNESKKGQVLRNNSSA